MHIVWLTYPVFLFSSAARFRFFQQHSDIQWGVENLYIGPACGSHCGGHGDCLDQRCLCDPGFTGPNCYASTPLKVESGSHSVKKSDHKRKRQVYLAVQDGHGFRYVCLFSVGISEGALWLGRGSGPSVAGAGGWDALHRLWCVGWGDSPVLQRGWCQTGCHCRSGPPRSKVSTSFNHSKKFSVHL